MNKSALRSQENVPSIMNQVMQEAEMDKTPLFRTIGMISSQARPNWHTQGLRLFEGHQVRQDSARVPIGLGSSCPGICLPTDFFSSKKKIYIRSKGRWRPKGETVPAGCTKGRKG